MGIMSLSTQSMDHLNNNQMENKKSKYKIYLSLASHTLVISYILLFILIWDRINAVFNQDETYITFLIILVRISITISFALILLSKWFKQEAIYLSDAYFLFSVFLIILIMGKAMDFYISLISFKETYNPDYLLWLFKVRYSLIILNGLPLLYLGLEILMNLFKVYIKEFSRKQFIILRISILAIYSITLLLYTLLSPSLELILSVLPIVTTITMIGIIVLFILMYRIKRLSQAHGLIIGLGFILIIISSLLRPSLTKGLELRSLITAELIDQILCIIIFIGFIKKPPYIKSIIK